MQLKPAPRRKAEPTIALINIVFLMLVFFLVAGQVTRPVDRTVTLIDASLPDASAPDDALVLHADGRLVWRDAPTTVAAFALAQSATDAALPLRILPDRDLAAADLIAVAADLRARSGRDIRLVTQQEAMP